MLFKGLFFQKIFVVVANKVSLSQNLIEQFIYMKFMGWEIKPKKKYASYTKYALLLANVFLKC